MIPENLTFTCVSTQFHFTPEFNSCLHFMWHGLCVSNRKHMKTWPAWGILHIFPKNCPGQQESGVVSTCFFVRGCGAVHMLLQKGSFLMTSHARPHWIFFQLVTGFDLHQRLPIDVAPLEGTHIILGQEAQTVWTVALE